MYTPMNSSTRPASDESVRYDSDEEAYDDVDITSLIQSVFLDVKKNRNIPDILCDIRRNMEVHNKLMLKLVQAVERKTTDASVSKDVLVE
jgi:hypothetical protein